MKLAFFAVLVFLLAASFVISQENGTQPATQPAADTATQITAQPSEEPSLTTQPAADQSSTQPAPVQDPLVQQPVQQPAAQPCSQVTTLAVDGTGNCRQFQDSCLPPGWSPVDRCPERKPAISPDQMPQGCKEVKDETGFVKMICETKPTECPQYSEAETKKCEMNNGKPNFFIDNRGCKIFECKFQESAGGGFLQPISCPSEEGRQRVSEKCKASGMNPVTKKDYNGCMFVECVSSFQKSPCPSNADWERVSKDCAEKKGIIVKEYDYQGCNIPKCEMSGQNAGNMQEVCINMPKEAFDRCRNEGGEMIVKENGKCITYAKCVKRGDEMNVEYDQVDEVPQSSVLLSLAFKLEQLKIEFDKLSKQTDGIANYYASAGDKDSEERFRKVSSMFAGAKQKIDDIKNKMRERIASLTKEDISDFKHDIKYIKEVVIQDILYVMLSNEGASYATSGTAANADMEGCGNDGECFKKALRTCEKTEFYPEGKGGTFVTIGGLEGKNCIIKMSVTKDGEFYDMACKYPNYVMGINGHEDLLPYCEGSMVSLVKQNPAPQKQTTQRAERAKPALLEPQTIPE